MTHGSLYIRTKGERRRLLLYTYHTGQAIPEAVQAAPGHHACRRFDYLAEARFAERLRGDREELLSLLRSSAADDGLSWAPSVASWIIAAKPGFLAPIPPGYVRDLDLGLVDYRYELFLSEEAWLLRKLHDVNYMVIEIDPWGLIVEALWQMISLGDDCPNCKLPMRRDRPDHQHCDRCGRGYGKTPVTQHPPGAETPRLP